MSPRRNGLSAILLLLRHLKPWSANNPSILSEATMLGELSLAHASDIIEIVMHLNH